MFLPAREMQFSVCRLTIARMLILKMRMNAEKIRDAVSQCLSGCYSSSDPRVALRDFVANLRRDPQWRPMEVEAVECKVTAILATILTPLQPD